MPDRQPDIIRVSSLTTYPECSRRSAAQMFRREIVAAGYKLRTLPRGIGAAAGTSVHKAAEVTLAEKAKGGSLPPLSVATDCAVETLKEEIKEGLEFDGIRGASRNAGEAEHQVISMSSAYHRVVAPTIEPILIEERLEAEVAPGLILSGKPDLVAREPSGIHDLKSGARGNRSHNPQIGGYSLLVRSNAIADVETASVDFVQRVRPDKTQPDPVSHPVRIADAETAAANIVRHIAEDLRVFREGDDDRHLLPGDPWAFLANPNSVLCGERYCSAWGTDFCREWKPKE